MPINTNFTILSLLEPPFIAVQSQQKFVDHPVYTVYVFIHFMNVFDINIHPKMSIRSTTGECDITH